MCVEGFSDLIREAVRCNVTHGTIICTNYISFIVTDDCFLFFRARESEVDAMENILATYKESSEQAINLQKSEIFCSRNTSTERCATMAQILVLYKC